MAKGDSIEQMVPQVDNVRKIVSMATQRDVDALSHFLSEGVDINLKDESGNGALIYAALEGHPDPVKILISFGADVNARGNDGSTPLMYAVISGSVETVKSLLEAGASVNIRNNSGLTALEIGSDTGMSLSIPFLNIRLTVNRHDPEIITLLKQSLYLSKQTVD
jgi:ankyrin repeat protein